MALPNSFFSYQYFTPTNIDGHDDDWDDDGHDDDKYWYGDDHDDDQWENDGYWASANSANYDAGGTSMKTKLLWGFGAVALLFVGLIAVVRVSSLLVVSFSGTSLYVEGII